MEKKTPILLPIRSVIFLLIFVIGAAIVGRTVDGISSWWSIAATAVNILTLGLLILIAKRWGQTYFEMINLHRGTPRKEMIVAVLVSLAVGYGGMNLAGLIFYGKLPYYPSGIVEPIPLVPAVINLFLLPVTTALAEDGLYLGYGVNGIRNKYAAVILPAFFYALQHCFIPTVFDAKYMVYRFVSFLPLTVVFCICYRKKRNPLPIMIAHTILDLATAVIILVTSADPGIYDKWMAAM